MNTTFLALISALERSYAAQTAATAAWHQSEPQAPAWTEEASTSNLGNLILAQHEKNFRLWHVEDKARRKDVTDAVIATCKREVDSLNQQRNDLIEKIDTCLVALMQPALPANPTQKQNTETLGMGIDRLSILALKVFHMEEQTARTDVDAAHIASCTHKLAVLNKQRSDLENATIDLVNEYIRGDKIPVLYHQFKMYNDPTLNPELYKNK